MSRTTNPILQVNRKHLKFGGFKGEPLAEQQVDVSFNSRSSVKWTASGPAWLKLNPTQGYASFIQSPALNVGINIANANGIGKQSGTLIVTDGTTTHQITVDLSQVARDEANVLLTGLEVTQGIQNLLNDVPFVAERPVFVRGHVKTRTGESVAKVTAQLVGRRDGAMLGALDPINPGGSIDVSSKPDRATLNDSFLFELPKDWRTGTVTLQLVGKSEAIACLDPAEKSSVKAEAHDCTVRLTYESVPALPIKYFLYRERGSEPTPADATAASNDLLASLPIPRVDQEINGTVLSYGGVRVNRSVAMRKSLARIKSEWEKADKPLVHYYGLFVPAKRGMGGRGAYPGFTSVGEYHRDGSNKTLNAHEIGHNLGRSHVGCGGPRSPDPNYPYTAQRISQELTGNAAYYGFNIVSHEIYPPTYKDYMSYCTPEWISPYTYKAQMEWLKTYPEKRKRKAEIDKVKKDLEGNRATKPVVIVTGEIFRSGATVTAIYDGNGHVASFKERSDYEIRFINLNGDTYATHPLKPQKTEASNGEEITMFTLVAPRADNLGRIVVLHNDQPIAEQVASAHAPTLKLTTDPGGSTIDNQALTIAWEAKDADGDPLTFYVDYSTDDGASWHKLAWALTESKLEINSDQLPGSQSARLRVSANDGFRTTFVESNAFTVADHSPVAIILSRNLNPYYVGGQTIQLEGKGYDAEDGNLTNLAWYSNRDGLLGKGSTLSLQADNLSEGTHLIRLEAKDTKGQSSLVGSIAKHESVRFDIVYDPLSLPAENGRDLASQELPDGWTLCAEARATCEYRGRMRVRYGKALDGKRTETTLNGPFRCHHDTPGLGPDPAVGEMKWCWVSVDRSSLVYEKPFTFTRGMRIDDGSHYLSLQRDGNYVVKTMNGDFVLGLNQLMSSEDYGRIAEVRFQADGNLAAYDANGGYVWSALNVPNNGGKLELRANGDLLLLDSRGETVWSMGGNESSTASVRTGAIVSPGVYHVIFDNSWAPVDYTLGAEGQFVETQSGQVVRKGTWEEIDGQFCHLEKNEAHCYQLISRNAEGSIVLRYLPKKSSDGSFQATWTPSE